MKVTKIITYTNGKQESQTTDVHSTSEMAQIVAAFYVATESLKHKDKIRSVTFNMRHEVPAKTNKPGKEVK